MLFTYHIVPAGSFRPLERGTVDSRNLESAKRHVQTIAHPNVAGRRDLEVRLFDECAGGEEKELWRGPYRP